MGDKKESTMVDINRFIKEHVIHRQYSMFQEDVNQNISFLENRIKGKSVCVIGGAGTIGSSFIKALLPFKPKSLVVVDTNENALTELTRDIRSSMNTYIPDEIITYPMGFESNVFRKMFISRKGFDIVGNFSAHKHVRSEKDIFSVEALIRNNVLNAKGLLDLLSDFPPEVYFCVSTDKAANPVNIMGASKRIMEDVIFSYSDRFPVKTARFANVAFSNGSLPAGFLERIQKLQPLSGPSDVRRYFVSPEESGQICMLACMLGENREVFYPKLKESQMMTFDEIGRNLLKENGYSVFECESEDEAIAKSSGLKQGGKEYPVFFQKSDTSGEKPYEEFYTENELIDEDRFFSLGVITGKEIPDKTKINTLFDSLNEAFDKLTVSKEDIVRILSNYLPNFEHIETGKSLDGKM